MNEPSRPTAIPRGLTLVGPFWTRRRVARHLGVPPAEVPEWPLLAISSPLGVEEAYPEFQFADVGVHRAISILGLLLDRRVEQCPAIDWFFRPNPRLRDLPPLQWLTDRGSFDAALEALPEPTKEIPGRADHDLEEARAAWRSGAAVESVRVGFTAPWDDTAA
jgi:hypothetical protein